MGIFSETQKESVTVKEEVVETTPLETEVEPKDEWIWVDGVKGIIKWLEIQNTENVIYAEKKAVFLESIIAMI